MNNRQITAMPEIAVIPTPDQKRASCTTLPQIVSHGVDDDISSGKPSQLFWHLPWITEAEIIKAMPAAKNAKLRIMQKQEQHVMAGL